MASFGQYRGDENSFPAEAVRSSVQASVSSFPLQESGSHDWPVEPLDGMGWGWGWDRWSMESPDGGSGLGEPLDLQWTSCPREITSLVSQGCLLLQQKPSLSWLTHFTQIQQGDSPGKISSEADWRPNQWSFYYLELSKKSISMITHFQSVGKKC